ncbi:hypothetical protein [Actimicrobium antarcticum]|uniref:Uncharacterized protein n=1 Tax=Actimicrobium antarcticum TaxID=1051899 RepID=A0ABP7SI48_9BURK
MNRSAANPAMSIALAPQWDERALPGPMATSCAVLRTGDTITLKFDSEAVPTVILTPYTAKRLAQLVERGMQEHTRRYGPV